MIEFLPQRGDGGSHILQHIPHGFPQKLDRRRRLLISSRKRLHADGFQCIIEKMRVDLARQHLKFHLLLPDQKFLFLDLRLICARLLLLDIADHDLQIPECLGKLVAAPESRNQLIILIAHLVHLLSEKAHPPRKVVRENMYQNTGNNQCHGNHRPADIQNAPYMVISVLIQCTDIYL